MLFFLETDSACLCLEPINIAASVTGKIAATFLCMYLWMQNLIALKMCLTCPKLAFSLSSMNGPGSFFQTMKNHPLSFSDSIMKHFSKEAGGCFEFANQAFYV